MILLIDNYDSFSYNLYQLIGSINPDIRVVRNDELTIGEIESLAPDAIILSPGPGRPSDAGIIVEAARHFAGKIPILGVCLGHQAICESFGATVSYAKHLMHGKPSPISVDTNCLLFHGLPETIQGARYHSLAVLEETLPEELVVCARTADGEVMAVRHRDFDVYGLQFHPESILTSNGRVIVSNFLSLIPSAPAENSSTAADSAAGSASPRFGKLLKSVIQGDNLDESSMTDAMNQLMSGAASGIQIASFLTALRLKGESTDEIVAAAAAMRQQARQFKPDFEVMDVVGTGGDELGTFNISPTSAFVAAAGGVKIAKHGNRAVSSRSGAADVLERLGVDINLSPEQSLEQLRRTGFCFLFAQKYHEASKAVAAVRKDLGIRTLFNILGPLANPAGAQRQLMGVYDERLLEPMARVLSRLGVVRGMVVRGRDGLDEATVSDATDVCEIRGGKIERFRLQPEDFGLSRAPVEQLIGGTPEQNAQITRDILSGKERGAKRDIVLLNAGLCLYLADKAETIKEGVRLAARLIDSGAAINKLKEATK